MITGLAKNCIFELRGAEEAIFGAHWAEGTRQLWVLAIGAGHRGSGGGELGCCADRQGLEPKDFQCRTGVSGEVARGLGDVGVTEQAQTPSGWMRRDNDTHGTVASISHPPVNGLDYGVHLPKKRIQIVMADSARVLSL